MSIELWDMRPNSCLLLIVGNNSTGGHLKCLQWLGNLNAASQQGITAAILAAIGGHLTCLQWLGDHGADLDEVTQKG